MTLTSEDLNAIRDELDQSLEDKLDDALSDVGELAHQVEWLRRDLELHAKNLKGQTKVMMTLCEKFAELRETVE